MLCARRRAYFYPAAALTASLAPSGSLQAGLLLGVLALPLLHRQLALSPPHFLPHWLQLIASASAAGSSPRAFSPPLPSSTSTASTPALTALRPPTAVSACGCRGVRATDSQVPPAPGQHMAVTAVPGAHTGSPTGKGHACATTGSQVPWTNSPLETAFPPSLGHAATLTPAHRGPLEFRGFPWTLSSPFGSS